MLNGRFLRARKRPLALAVTALCLTLLSACSGKMVQVVDETGFQRMLARLAPALKAQQILDEDGAYLTSLVSAGTVPSDAGARLFEHLSPAFRYGGGAAETHRTFAASHVEGDGLEIRPGGFTLNQGVQRVTVTLLGIADWNDDRQDDWLVLCSVYTQRQDHQRDYYLVITDPQAEIMRGRLFGVYDCRSRRCVSYTTPSELRALAPESPTVDLEAGQRQITAPPGAANIKPQQGPGTLREEKLQN